MRVAFLGRTKILLDSIDVIANAGHDVALIGTCKSAPEYSVNEEDFKRKAKEYGAEFFCNVHINSMEIISILKSVNADVAVSMNWISIIQDDAISCFRYGILNAHCGDLPRYRGNACPNWAILMGEKDYAITVHYMTAGELDSGNIIIKKKFPIKKDTYITDIYNVMDDEIPQMFLKALELIREGKGDGYKQSDNNDDILRCYPRIPTDSFIDWNDTCENIIRIIRASSQPFQGAFFYYGDMKIRVLEADTKKFDTPCFVIPGQVISVNRDIGDVDIAARDGIITIKKIYIFNEQYRASDVLKSSRIRLNYCLSDEIYKLIHRVADLENELKRLSGR